MIRIIGTVIISLSFIIGGFSQSKKSLEKQRADYEKRIRLTEEILSQKRDDAVKTVLDLKALNQQIAQSQEVTHLLKTEQTLLAKEVQAVKEEADSLQNEFNRYKQEYGDAIYHFSKAHGNVNSLALLFSSESLEQLIARLDYLKLYQKSRKKQILDIISLKSQLDSTQLSLQKSIGEKDMLIQLEEAQAFNLHHLLELQEDWRKKLQSEVKNLQLQLNNQQQALNRLERAVSRNIPEETATAKPVANEPEAITEAETPEKKPPAKTVDASSRPATTFKELKENMDWPVAEGFITGRYGRQPHPVLAGVFVDNLGVDIRTKPKSPVMPVFSGKVTAVTKVPGMNFMVMVEHGEYFTVYAKLEKVKVKSGQKVTDKTILGYPASEQEGVAEIQFQIWHQRLRLNPEEWLKR